MGKTKPVKTARASAKVFEAGFETEALAAGLMQLGGTARSDGDLAARTGPEIRPSGAQPFLVGFTPLEMVPGSTLRQRPAGYLGRHAARVGDAFDRMADAAARNKVAEPFTPGQVSAGRAFAALVERLAAAGIKCSSLDDTRGGTDGHYLDAVIADRQRFDAMQARIGPGMALELRRVRSSDRGPGGRVPLSTMQLVADVCLSGLTISDALKKAGWSHKNARHLHNARSALAGALDRMHHPDLDIPTK